VRFTELPATVPEDMVFLLKQQCNQGSVLDMTGKEPFVFKSGDEVEITAGSFKGLQAIIKEQKGEDRVVLLLTLLGKEQAMELPLGLVKPT
jgi:transcriptional antiterminator RfaH